MSNGKVGTFKVYQEGYMGRLSKASWNGKKLSWVPNIPEIANKKRTKKGFVYIWRAKLEDTLFTRPGSM